MNKDDSIVEVEKSDLVYLHRILDSMYLSVSCEQDGDEIDIDSVLIDLDSAMNVVEDYLK